MVGHNSVNVLSATDTHIQQQLGWPIYMYLTTIYMCTYTHKFMYIMCVCVYIYLSF